MASVIFDTSMSLDGFVRAAHPTPEVAVSGGLGSGRRQHRHRPRLGVRRLERPLEVAEPGDRRAVAVHAGADEARPAWDGQALGARPGDEITDGVPTSHARPSVEQRTTEAAIASSRRLPRRPEMTRNTVRGRFFWLLKNTLNRLTTRMARSGHGPFALIRHVGRKTGRTYETPVILAPVPQGFVAELTYGDKVDWYRNIVAAGECVVIHHGKEYRVNSIESCSPEQGRRAYPAPFRQVLRATARKEFRLLRTAA
jgi:deazaflavin-dependent oxidoreductase (nitroreductase family)